MSTTTLNTPRSVPIPVQPEPLSPRTDFGLVGWLEQTRIRLPLEAVDYHFIVSGDIVDVVVKQRYYQSNAKPINCRYTFPLPSGAAVHRCVVHVGERTITATVKEKEQARKEYREAVAAGHRAGLVESERENLFTLNLGNLQPGDEIVTELAYFQKVERNGRDADAQGQWLGDNLCIRIPTCPGVKYIPGNPMGTAAGQGTVGDTDRVPDASRISPPRMPAKHPEVATLHVLGRIESGNITSGTLRSVLHPLQQREEQEAVVIEIDPDGNVPDRDIVLRWQENPTQQAGGQAWTYTNEGQTYALVRLVAPEQTAASAGYSQDVYVLLDQSGSMLGDKWVKSVEALHRLVQELGDQDRVWITFFANQPQDFATRPLNVKELSASREFQQLTRREPKGGTEMLPAVEHVLQAIRTHSLSQEREVSVLLITDGQTSEEQAVMGAFKNYGKVRVHTIGIDTAVNDALLRSLARQQRGQVALHTPNDDIAGSMQRLARRLRQPVLLDFRPGPGWESPAPQLPDLYAGEIITVCLRAAQPGTPLSLQGKLPHGQDFPMEIKPQPSANPAIALLWASERITQLLENGQRAEATELSIQSNLICATTAFLAVDSAQKVDVAQQEVYQPSVEPLFLSDLAEQDHTAAKTCNYVSASAVAGAKMYYAAPFAGGLHAGQGLLARLKMGLSEPRDPGAVTRDSKLAKVKEHRTAAPIVGSVDVTQSPSPSVGSDTANWDELRNLSVFQTVLGRCFLRLLTNWVKDNPTVRQGLVKTWVATLRGKSAAEIITACLDFARRHMVDEPQAIIMASGMK